MRVDSIATVQDKSGHDFYKTYHAAATSGQVGQRGHQRAACNLMLGLLFHFH